jgi:hypothetical protein
MRDCTALPAIAAKVHESDDQSARCPNQTVHRPEHPGPTGEAKVRKDTVARRVRYAAPVFTNELIEYPASFGQALERADFISAHEVAIAFDIRCEDGDEASADCDRV